MVDATRRQLITLLGGAAAAWPLAARAQQPERIRRIGVLMSTAADDPETPVNLAAFLQGLQESGWTLGRNIRIDYRWGAGSAEFYRKQVTDLVGLAPDVIVTNGTSTIGPALQTTRTVPIVFVNVTDPVGQGFVASLSRLGGDVTGFSANEFEIAPKLLATADEIIE